MVDMFTFVISVLVAALGGVAVGWRMGRRPGSTVAAPQEQHSLESILTSLKTTVKEIERLMWPDRSGVPGPWARQLSQLIAGFRATDKGECSTARLVAAIRLLIVDIKDTRDEWLRHLSVARSFRLSAYVDKLQELMAKLPYSTQESTGATR